MAWSALALIGAIIGIAGYLAFLATVDVPMYLTRWRDDVASGSAPSEPSGGFARRNRPLGRDP